MISCSKVPSASFFLLLLLFSPFESVVKSLTVLPSVPNQRCVSLFGLLDDFIAEDSSPSQEVDAEVNQENEDLFHALIFASDTRADIRAQLTKCTSPTFLAYLKTSKESSNDKEEARGLQELIDLIGVVEATVNEEQEELLKKELKSQEATLSAQKEEPQDEAKPKNTELLSNADVLKQANAIDHAVMTAAMNDDEKPSDFISDCREVVNLSGGFNNQGRMRVGGR